MSSESSGVANNLDSKLQKKQELTVVGEVSVGLEKTESRIDGRKRINIAPKKNVLSSKRPSPNIIREIDESVERLEMQEMVTAKQAQ